MVTTIQANRNNGNNVILIVISTVCTIVAVGTLILIIISIICLCHYGKQTDCIDYVLIHRLLVICGRLLFWSNKDVSEVSKNNYYLYKVFIIIHIIISLLLIFTLDQTR